MGNQFETGKKIENDNSLYGYRMLGPTIYPTFHVEYGSYFQSKNMEWKKIYYNKEKKRKTIIFVRLTKKKKKWR